MTAIRANIPKLYAFSGSYMLLVLLPVFIPFLLDRGLLMEQVFQLQAIFAFSVIAFEIPSGYIADLWGRKNCLIVGGLCNGLGYSLLLWTDSFWGFVAYEVLLGIAASMYSGADVALLYDSLEHLQESVREKQRAVGNILASRSIAEALAAVLNSLILIFGVVHDVLLLQVICGWLPLVISLRLVEVRARTVSASHLDNFKKIARQLFWDSKLIRYISLTMTVWGMSTFYAVWLFQKYWLEAGVELSYFGWLWALYNFTVAVTSKITHRIELKFGSVLLLLLMGVLPILAYLSMALSIGLLGVVSGLLFQVARGIHQVSLKDALNRRIPSDFRATANSIISFGFRGTFLVSGPAVGYMVDQLGLQTSLYVLAGLFSILFLVIIIPFMRCLSFEAQN